LPGRHKGRTASRFRRQSFPQPDRTEKVWTIEIIKPLAERARGIDDDLIAQLR